MTPPPTAEPLIEVKNLVKSFKVFDHRSGVRGAVMDLFQRTYRTVEAVDDVSFSIGRGEMVGYIGANGAGKSTTIRMLSGILFPTSGQILVDGRVPWKDREAHVQHIGAVFGQRSQLWWDLAAGESLRLLANIYNVSEADRLERMAEFQAVLELEPLLKTPVRKLSLGQKMRCEIAAALLHNPPILFLDEPTIGLDVVAKQSIRRFLKKINEERGVTMILTTHDLREIEALCERVIIIDHGKIAFDGSLEKLREKAGHEVILRFRLAQSITESQRSNLPGSGIKWEAVGAEWVATLSDSAPPRTEVIRKFLEIHGDQVQDIAIDEPQIEQIVQRIYGTSEQ